MMRYDDKWATKLLLFIHTIKVFVAILVPVFVSVISLGGELRLDAFISTLEEINKICLEGASAFECKYFFVSPLLVSTLLIFISIFYLYDDVKFRKPLLFAVSLYLINWLALLLFGRDYSIISLDGIAIFCIHICLFILFIRDGRVKLYL